MCGCFIYLFIYKWKKNKLIRIQRLGTINNPYFKSTHKIKKRSCSHGGMWGEWEGFIQITKALSLYLYFSFCCLKSHLPVNYISFLDLSFLERLLFFTHLTCLYVTHCALTGKVSHFVGKLHLCKWTLLSPPPSLLSIKLVDWYYKW